MPCAMPTSLEYIESMLKYIHRPLFAQQVIGQLAPNPRQPIPKEYGKTDEGLKRMSRQDVVICSA